MMNPSVEVTRVATENNSPCNTVCVYLRFSHNIFALLSFIFHTIQYIIGYTKNNCVSGVHIL